MEGVVAPCFSANVNIPSLQIFRIDLRANLEALPFPFSCFLMSVVLSLPFWLLTADSQIYSKSGGCEEERRLFLFGTNVCKTYTMYTCTCICKHFFFYFGMMSVLLNCLKVFYIRSIVFFSTYTCPVLS